MSHLIVCATVPEIEPFRAANCRDFDRTAGLLTAAGDDMEILVTGVGKTNSAIDLTRYLSTRLLPDRIINIGIAGGWQEAGVGIGDIVVATEDIYGDEGVTTDDGFRTLSDLGFATVHNGDETLYHRFPLPDGEAVAGMIREKTGMPVHAGPLLTVSACSGTDRIASDRYRRFGALAESMEGAALAHVAALFDVPFIEIRGISNFTGAYDKSTWRIGEAVNVVNRALAAFMED